MVRAYLRSEELERVGQQAYVAEERVDRTVTARVTMMSAPVRREMKGIRSI